MCRASKHYRWDLTFEGLEEYRKKESGYRAVCVVFGLAQVQHAGGIQPHMNFHSSSRRSHNCYYENEKYASMLAVSSKCIRRIALSPYILFLRFYSIWP